MASFKTSHEITYLQPLARLSDEALKELLRERGVATDGSESRDDLERRANARDVEGALHVGARAIDARAREMAEHLGKLDRQAHFRPGGRAARGRRLETCFTREGRVAAPPRPPRGSSAAATAPRATSARA